MALRTKLLTLLVVMVGLMSSSATLAAEWVRAETDHFIGYSNISVNTTREYLQQLEAFKYLAEHMLGVPPQSEVNTPKFTLYLLNQPELLKVVRPEFSPNVGGVYMHCVEGAQAFAWRPLKIDRDGGDTGLIDMEHEYSQHLMFSRLKSMVPAWYVAGFSDYLSTVTYDKGKFVVGGSANSRVTALTNGTPWINFSVILDPKQYSVASAGDQFDQPHFYAQSWVLTHYMLSDSARTKAFNDYFDRVARGEDAITAFQSSTGIVVNKLEGELVKYRRDLPKLKITVPVVPDNEVSITPIPADQSEYLLLAAVLTTCPSPEYGKQLTAQLRVMRAGHEAQTSFRLALDRAEILFGDIPAAQAELQKIITADTNNAEAHYLLGRSYYDIAVKAKARDISLMDKASHEFAAAYKIDRINAANLYFLARSLDTSAMPSKSVVNASVGATVYAPSIAEYAFYAGFVSMRSGNTEQAIRLLQPFASDPQNLKQAALVTNMIAAIKAGKSVAEVMAMNDAKPEAK